MRMRATKGSQNCDTYCNGNSQRVLEIRLFRPNILNQQYENILTQNLLQLLMVVLFTAKHKMSRSLGDIVGRVDDLSGPESNVRVADQCAL